MRTAAIADTTRPMVPLDEDPRMRAAHSTVIAKKERAADAEADWNRIVALDAGPKVQARTQNEVRQAAMMHLAQQEQALRSFLAAHPSDANAFEARLRLSRVMQIRADFEKSPKHRTEAKRLLDEAEKLANAWSQIRARAIARCRAANLPPSSC